MSAFLLACFVCGRVEVEIHCVVQADLRVLILRPQLPKSWDYRHSHTQHCFRLFFFFFFLLFLLQFVFSGKVGLKCWWSLHHFLLSQGLGVSLNWREGKVLTLPPSRIYRIPVLEFWCQEGEGGGNCWCLGTELWLIEWKLGIGAHPPPFSLKDVPALPKLT